MGIYLPSLYRWSYLKERLVQYLNNNLMTQFSLSGDINTLLKGTIMSDETATTKKRRKINNFELALILNAVKILNQQHRLKMENIKQFSQQDESHWPTTREISEHCQFSIYKTRHLLIKLSEEGYIRSSGKVISNSLHWSFISDDVCD